MTSIFNRNTKKRKTQKKGKQMAKEDIFSKINFRDYNNELENILEQKDFSSDVKNLLLSMLYKIENGYQDYEMVKVNVSTKKNFLKKIIQIIQKECQQINLIKPLSEESKELEEKQVNYLIDKEKGIISVYPNERMVLEALVTLNQKEIEIEDKYELFSIGLKDVLTVGNRMNLVEVIRDFNGWSWDITTSQMESKNINIVYQNLLLLLGNQFLKKWLTDDISQEEEETFLPNNEILRSKYNNSFGLTQAEVQKEEKIDYVQAMQNLLCKKYGEELGKLFVEQFIKTVIAIGSNRNQIQKQKIIEKQKEIQQMLTLMQDNKKYLESLSKRKKEINLYIKKIDTWLNNETLLKEEYQERNRKLPNKEKIFSVSHLKIMLDKERKSLLEEIKECNKQMEPKEFVSKKNELEEKLQFFESIGVKETEKVDETKQIDLLQNIFLDCFLEKVKKAEGKKDIHNIIYELRYYEQIPYRQKQEEQGKQENQENQQIQEKLKQVEKELIKKACLAKIFITFSKEEEINEAILANQFQSKIINLENTIYILKYHKGILKIQIYDGTIEEETKEIPITKKVELQVKLNKKIKLWE